MSACSRRWIVINLKGKKIEKNFQSAEQKLAKKQNKLINLSTLLPPCGAEKYEFGAHPYPFYRRQLFGRGLLGGLQQQCDSCELVSVALLCQAIYYIPTGKLADWRTTHLPPGAGLGAGHLTGQRIYLSISILDALVPAPKWGLENLAEISRPSH